MPSIPFSPDTTPAARNERQYYERLIAERHSEWLMWRRVRLKRRRGTRSWFNAFVHERAAVMRLDSAYRLAAGEGRK